MTPRVVGSWMKCRELSTSSARISRRGGVPWTKTSLHVWKVWQSAAFDAYHTVGSSMECGWLSGIQPIKSNVLCLVFSDSNTRAHQGFVFYRTKLNFPTILPTQHHPHSFAFTATRSTAPFNDLPEYKNVNTALILVLPILSGARLKKTYCCPSLTLPGLGGSCVDPKPRA